MSRPHRPPVPRGQTPAGRAEIINRCEKRLIDVPQTVEILRRQQALGFGAHLRNQILAHERRRHAEFVFVAVIVDAHLFQLGGVCHAIPAEIVASVARHAIRRPRPKLGSRAPEADRPGRRKNRETWSCGCPARDRIHSARRARCNSRNRSAAPPARVGRERWTGTHRIRQADRRAHCDRWRNRLEHRRRLARRARTHVRNDNVDDRSPLIGPAATGPRM